MKLQMAGVKEGFDPIPPSTYICEVTACDPTGSTSAESEKYPNQPMIKYEFTVTEGDYKGRKLFYNCILHPDLLGSLKALGRCSGQFTEEQMESEWDLPDEGREFMGVQLKAVVRIRKYKGDDVNDIRKIMPVTDADMSEESLLP